jgi:hypothetical protein
VRKAQSGKAGAVNVKVVEGDFVLIDAAKSQPQTKVATPASPTLQRRVLEAQPQVNVLDQDIGELSDAQINGLSDFIGAQIQERIDALNDASAKADEKWDNLPTLEECNAAMHRVSIEAIKAGNPFPKDETDTRAVLVNSRNEPVSDPFDFKEGKAASARSVKASKKHHVKSNPGSHTGHGSKLDARSSRSQPAVLRDKKSNFRFGVETRFSKTPDAGTLDSPGFAG